MVAYKDKLVAINYELRDCQKKEQKLLFDDPFWKKAVSKTTGSARAKIEDKIPEKLEDNLNKAFTAAFKMVFQEGKVIIKKTYNEETLKSEYVDKRVGVQTKGDRSLIKKLRQPAEKRYLKSLGVATTEGVGLGLLGIGLPDIPILIGNMIRTCTVSAQSHGLDTDRKDEQIYMLLLIRLAAMPVEEREAVNKQLDALGDAIDAGRSVVLDLDKEMQTTSERLSMTMLFSRFVMGLPIVGVAGGLYNPVIVGQLHQLAEVKYEVRLLKRCKADLVRQYHKDKGDMNE
ncbi:MAG: EcsC family protein [Peptococcaceae bacterium]|nr:EcsC family protein [Peptococcaceae bacterium]